MKLRLSSLLLVVAFAACSRPAAVGTFPTAPVVLISIDTLRADHLPAYGYARGRTPVLDALAKEGVVFEDVYSHCPLTLPSHASMLTGLLPPHTEVRDNMGFTLKPAHETLATRFKAAGRRTGGAISAYVLRSQTGIGRGFDFFDDAIEIEGSMEALGSLQRDGAIAVDSLSRWIEEQGGQPFLAFLHLYEPHTPYAPPERYSDLPAYDGEVAHADELVGRFLDRLKAKGLYGRSIVVVTSDHGEGLGQHGVDEHGLLLYREAVHVPLILRLPGGARAGTRVSGTVGLVDLPATLLDLAGLKAAGLDGVSLRPALASGSMAPREVYSETLYPRYHFGWSELYSVTQSRLRYIHGPRPELFDVGSDPEEARNILDQRASTAAAMRAWLTRTVTIGDVSAPEDVSPEVKEKLAALGYVGGGPTVGAQGELPDPKDKLGVYQELLRAMALRKASRDAEAVAAFQRVLADNPMLLDAWEALASLLFRMGRTQRGIAAMDKVLAVDPGRLSAHLALAKIYALDGKLEKATAHAEIASEKSPGQGQEMLAQIMMDRGDLKLAAQFARRSVAADDRRIMSHFILGVVAQRAGRYEEALASFRKAEAAKALQKRTRVRNLHADMADCLARLGREAEAEQEFLAEIKEIPSSESGRVGLAMLYRSQGRDGEARAALRGLVEAQPHPNADVYATVVRTFLILEDRAAAAEWAARARAQFPADPRFSGRGGG